ncbi:MAG: hypothetical protein NTV22_02580 [bacterium]|nr:hypothetical protein [bacterium]
MAWICAAPALFALTDARWSFISNDYVRLGVITNYGATIGHFSLVTAAVNFVNYMDAGRMIQQSYYGEQDGSSWAGNPWHWNPVQGGSYLNDKPALLAFSNVNNRIYAKVHPRNWAGRQLLTNVVMEEWIDLTGRLARIVFTMTYTGPSNYAARHQEVPAMFMDAAYPRLTYCTGATLTNFQPAGVNGFDNSTESWWAYVNAAGDGMGIMTPPTTFATYYWIAGSGNEGGGCSYVSPMQTFGITPNLVHQYTVYLTIGTTQQIRTAFRAMPAPRARARHASCSP